MRKITSILLAFVLALTLVPTAWAEDEVAKIGDTPYTSLDDALSSAKAGDVITLTADVTINNSLTIDKAITIDGGEEKHAIKGESQQYIFTINTGGTSAQVTLKNLTLEAVNSFGRAIGLGTDNQAINGLNLSVENCRILTKQRGISVYSDNNSAMTLNVKGTEISLLKSDGTAYNYEIAYNPDIETSGIFLWQMGNSEVNITASTIQGFAYDITYRQSVANTKTTVTIDNSTLKGRAGINDFSCGTEWNVTGCDIRGINNESGSTEGFACVVLNSGSSDLICNVNNTQFTTYFNEAGKENKYATEYLFSNRGSNNKIIVDKTTEGGSAASAYSVLSGDKGGINSRGTDPNIELYGGTYNVDPTAYLAAGYTAAKANDTWTVSKTTASESAATVTATTETTGGTTKTTITTITADTGETTGTNTIDVSSNVTLDSNNKTAEVTVSKDVLDEVVTTGDAAKPVEFKVAENASVTFNKEAVQSIAENSAFDGNITLVVTPDAAVTGKEETAKQSVTTDTNAKVVELKLVGSGNANLFEAAAGAKATVTVPFDAKNNNTVKVYYLKSDGTAKYVGTATINNNKTVTFTVSHFSSYVLVPTTVTTYHYYNAGTSTTTGNTTSSPKTFDPGVGIYALTAVLSVTGMACVGKKKF